MTEQTWERPYPAEKCNNSAARSSMAKLSASRTKRESGTRKIPFRLHPRVFAALGADLVTNDVVAIIELVKNSYDAFATRVDVIFRNSSQRGLYLEIKDDGVGMDRKTIEEAWCVV